MIDWFIQQSILLSALVALLLLGRNYLNQWLGAKATYWLWGLLPICCLVSVFTPFLAKQPNQLLQQYIVATKTELAMVDIVQVVHANNIVVWLWFLVVLTLVLAVVFFHQRYLSLLSLAPCSESLTKLVHQQKCTGQLAIKQSDVISSPVLVNAWRATLVLPTQFVTKFDTSQQQMIIRHELMHYKQGDLIWNAFAVALVILNWFNPIMWWGFKAFRQQQELACDQAVLHNKSLAECQSCARAMISATSSDDVSFITQLNYCEKTFMKERIMALGQHHKGDNWLAIALIVVSSLTISATQLVMATEQVAQQQVTPQHRIQPKYPFAAANNKVEGFVVMSFSVETDGKVTDIQVERSQPSGVFDKSAVKALSQWRYHPVDYKVVNLQVQLDFVMDESHQPNFDKTEIITVMNK